MTAPTLTEFLLARIAEDEAAAEAVFTEPPTVDPDYPSLVDNATRLASRFHRERVLAECEAKRRIVEDFEILHRDYRETHNSTTGDRRFQALVAISQLAAVYADHPDYREEWLA